MYLISAMMMIVLAFYIPHAVAQTLTPYYAGGGNPQAPAVVTETCSTMSYNGSTVALPCAPGIAPSDPNNAAFKSARVLTPSGTAGHPGTIAGLPYPATMSGTTASATNTGYSFGYVCPSAGIGSITLIDGSVLPYAFGSTGGFSSDTYEIIDAEPPVNDNCTFAVLR